MTKIEIKIKNAMLCMTRQCWEQGIAAEALLETEDFDSLELWYMIWFSGRVRMDVCVMWKTRLR